MAAITPLTAVTLLPAEITAVRTANGFEDAAGTLAGVLLDLNEISMQLNRIAGLMPAGANQTAIQAAITALA